MQLQVTKSKLLSSLSWIKQGWRVFTLQPGPFMSMSAIIMLMHVLQLINPIFGVVSFIAIPFLTIGYYQAASKAEAGESVSVSDVFVYFSQIAKYRVLLRLALLNLVFAIVVSMSFVPIQEAMLNAQPANFYDVVKLSVLLAINYMLFAFAVPAAWVSPSTPIMTLMKQSFYACWTNALPLSLYGLSIFLLAIISFPIVIVGWLIVYSLAMLSFYQMFLNIYQPVHLEQAQDIESTNSSEDVESTETDKKDN